MRMQEATQPLLRLEVDETVFQDDGQETADGVSSSTAAFEFEILSPIAFVDERQAEIYREVSDIDRRLELINAKVDELNAEIGSLTNQADGLDYTIAVASGIIAGIIDSVWVGEFSLDKANDWGNKKVDDFVIETARWQGYTGNDLHDAVEFLESKNKIIADKATAAFGGGKQHHLRDFSHHPTLVGLFFSLLTQFTGKIYGTDATGAFQVISIKEMTSIKPNDLTLIGKNLPEKLTFGIVKWFFHMVSDMAGSSGSIMAGSVGTGLPGPLVSLLKEVSTLPIFRSANENGYKDFSVWISKLFNGTLLAKRDENGKITEAVKFDLRTEIGIEHELGRQAIPVIINECVVRGFYFIRRLVVEIKEKDVSNIKELGKIDWKKTLPFKNRTVVRMLTISSGIFTAFDVADAAIRSGGLNPACLLRVNYVGVGRFVIAVGADVVMGAKKSKKERERMMLKGEQLGLLNAKLFYKQADMWIEAENTDKAMHEAYIAMDIAAIEFMKTWNEIRVKSERIEDLAEKISETDPAFADELLDILEYGI